MDYPEGPAVPLHINWTRVVNFAQTIFETSVHHAGMASADEYRDRADEARAQAERSFSPIDREAWLRIAEEWMKLAQTRDGPIDGVIGALSRIYVK